jgi:hypothetical protein
VHWTPAETYQVEVRVTDPGTHTGIARVRGPSGLDTDELSAVHHDAKRYGELLTRQLFKDSCS